MVLPFKRHNLVLPDGAQTAPGRPVIAESQQFKAIIRILRLLYQEKAEERIRIADLGCLEGGYATELANRGYQVLGIEGRESHLRACSFLATRFNLQNLQFVHDRVENLERYGDFDVIYASGILYHLKNPAAFLRLLGKLTKKLLILNTHFATEKIPSRFRHKLSGLVRHEGRWGRWYQEWDPETPPDAVQQMDRSSLDNSRSFWLREDELLSQLRDSGFEIILEHFDCHYDMLKAHQAKNRNSRSQFIAIKR